jgi:AbrB family looped-hinge helix DNA binding protein
LTNYVFHIKLKSMKIGERGQVTIPKEIRDRFGLRPETEVEFRVVKDAIILEKKPKRLNLNKWKGHCKGSLSRLGYESVNDFIEDVRGR